MAKYIVWDFNGTILDDVSLCLEINNSILQRLGIPAVDIERHLEAFDFPVINFYEKIGIDTKRLNFDDIVTEYISLYNPASINAPLRDGVKNAFEKFKSGGYSQIVLSAAKLTDLEEQLTKLGIRSYFDFVLGLSDNYAKGKADTAKKWISEQQIKSDDITIIGDTTHDYFVATELGWNVILLTGGHNSYGRLKATGAAVYNHIDEVLREYRLQ